MCVPVCACVCAGQATPPRAQGRASERPAPLPGARLSGPPSFPVPVPLLGAFYMGHLLSREPRNRPSQKRPRCCSWCRRRRPLLRLPRRTPAKAPPQPAAPRSRDCFFRGPCMLCFIVHSPGAPAPAGLEEEPPLSPPPRDGAYAAAASSQHLARRYAALAAEDCAAAARRFLLSSAAAAAAAAASASSPASCCKELGLAAAAAWEQQGRSLFLASVGPVRFLGPPAALQLFRGPTPPPPPPAEPPTPPEMVCKRKGAGVPACTPCKQPRCGGGACGGGGSGGGPTGGGASPPRPPDAGCCQGPEQQPQPLCPPRSSPTSESAPTEASGDSVRAGGTAPLPAQQQHECGDADCQEPPENPCDCHREPPSETPDINQLPPSILLKVGLGEWRRDARFPPTLAPAWEVFFLLPLSAEEGVP